MSMTDCPAGSKLNPLSEDIHQRDVAHHNWMGGWVGTSDNPTYYDRQNEERTCSGSHSAPYDADVYDELTDNAMWIGGLALEGKLAPQLSECCTTIVPQLPSKAPSAYVYLVAVIDTSARMYKTKKDVYYFAYTSLNRISGFALDTSARQSNEKFFTLFLAFALA